MSSNVAITSFPVIHFYDSNDTVDADLHVTSTDATLESDVISYIKTRMASVSGVGTIHAVKADLNTTSV